MVWLLASLGASLSFAAVNLVDKAFLVHFVRNVRQAVMIIGFFSFIFFIVFIIYSPVPFSIEWLPSLGGGFFEILSIYMYLSAIRSDEVGYMVPLFGLSPIFAYILSVIVFQDGIHVAPILGAAIITVSLFLLQYARYGMLFFKMSSAVILMLLAALFYALQGTFLHYDPFQWTVLEQFVFSRLGVFLGTLLIILPKIKEINGLLLLKNYVFVVSELLYLLATYLFIIALVYGDTVLVLSALNTQPLFVLGISYFMHKKWPNILDERFVWKIKWLAPVSLVVMVFGIILLEM